MKSLMALVLTGSGMAVAQDAVQWRVEDGGNGHWYQQQEASGCIQDDIKFAEDLAGSLLCVNSHEEWMFITEYALSQSPVFRIGALGPAITGGSWEWVSGEEWTVEFWAPANSTCPNTPYPNNGSSGAQVVVNNCDDVFGGLIWDDYGFCDNEETVIVEWSSDCNNDGIVDYGQTLDGSLIDFDENGVPDICEARQWLASDGGNGHWYQVVVLGQGTTTEKLAYARTVGAELASLLTPEEFEFAAFTVCNSPSFWIEDENGCLCGGPAIGGYRAPESDFSWLDGSIWDYSPWHGGNPDGVSSDAQLVRLWDYFGNRRFVDHRLLGETGADIQSVLLEWSSDCNGDGIVDYGQILNGSLVDQDGNGVPDGCFEGACCIGSTCIFSTALSCEQAGGTFESSDAGCSSQVCEPDCVGDITGDGAVDFTDLLIIVSTWGPCSDG